MTHNTVSNLPVRTAAMLAVACILGAAVSPAYTSADDSPENVHLRRVTAAAAGVIAAMREVKHGFHALCLDAGRHVLSVMMENDRAVLCGPKWRADARGQRARHSSDQQRSDNPIHPTT